MDAQVGARSAEPLGRLVKTKLTPPPPRAGRVVRRRLIDCLDAGLAGPLILVAAPAGFGKTTLVVDWLGTSAQRSRTLAWLALDEADNDPARFWSYVVGALETARPGVAAGALELLGVPGAATVDNIVDELAHDLSTIADPIVLVLDDYHTVVTPTIHAGLASVLERLPPSVHLVVSTRSDPPLPLARMRARAQVTEVRAVDLRFTAEETAEFLAEVMGLELTPDQLAVLGARTEGWVAGLQLAGLSLQRQAGDTERAAFVRAFGGSHRFVVDYLVDEVLAQQPERIGAFLLRTSILQRLSGPLCHAVTGEADSQALLETIERANLFLVPLDDQRGWYRYHHLFGDVLRHRLSQQLPDLLPELHHRASTWCATNGLEQVAIEHALVAHDWATAARLIDSVLWSLHARGERETVRRWLLAVPEDARKQFPLLQLSLGHAWLSGGEFDKAADVLREVHDTAGPNTETIARALLLEANLAVQRGDPSRAIACAERARSLLPRDDPRSHSSAAVLLESAYLARGDLHAAERIFAEARPAPEQPVVSWLLRSDRAVLDALRGRLHDAARRHREVLREVGDLPVVYAVEQHWRLAALHLEWNELDVADEHLVAALARTERAHADVFLARIQLTRAQLLLARDDLTGASDALDAAERAAERVGNRLHVRWTKAQRARLQLLRGNAAAAEQWALALASASDLDSIEREPEALVMARVDLARGQPHAALRTVGPVLERADATGCEASAIRVLVILALVQASGGDVQRAIASLEDALRRGEPGGFRRVFLDEGQALVPLLRQARNADRVQVATLLAALDARAKPSPVSSREQEVLVLVAEGLSNREIADRLVVTPNTVKAHVRHLGTKLGASSRTQLLARARSSGLLP
jgi:LuxR family transcriptional regulator, maltose regulon positive regulatory protein